MGSTLPCCEEHTIITALTMPSSTGICGACPARFDFVAGLCARLICFPGLVEIHSRGAYAERPHEAADSYLPAKALLPQRTLPGKRRRADASNPRRISRASGPSAPSRSSKHRRIFRLGAMVKPLSPALAGRFFTTEPPGKT